MSKILICDDNPSQVSALKTYLTSIGHEVFSALDPLSLIVIAKSTKPDLVFMDVQMPAGGGAQGVKNLHNNPALAGVRIIFSSGLPLEQVQRMFPEDPRFRFLPKPVDLMKLRALIRELLPDAA